MNASRTEPEAARSKVVLLVEDDHDVRVSLRRLLEEAGYEVWTAGDGRNAFELLERAAGLPDVVVVDLMMPVMDGWKLIEALRHDDRFAALPVIVQSAFRHLPPPGGVVAFLDKPIDEEALLRAIRRHVIRFMPSAGAS